MKALKRFVERDPSGALALLTALAGAVCAAAGRPEFAPVLVAAAAAIIGLRTQVTPAKKADELIQFASTQAALATAQNLTDGTAGQVGEITGPAAAVVDLALEQTGRLVAAKR